MSNNSERIARLKTKARRAYFAYYDASENAPTMGNHLLQHVSLQASLAARAFDEAMAELKEIDPFCPSFKPLTSADR